MQPSSNVHSATELPPRLGGGVLTDAARGQAEIGEAAGLPGSRGQARLTDDWDVGTVGVAVPGGEQPGHVEEPLVEDAARDERGGVGGDDDQVAGTFADREAHTPALCGLDAMA
ncbi:hypothetical protein AB0L65_34850 [Nonomuraea sp. NPDC052116]|uniref:hypothetical protein n=1 Tax=Nonomuraea sp. NPDC052116 TaxID=3155665 RepID=UPI00343F6674